MCGILCGIFSQNKEELSKNKFHWRKLQEGIKKRGPDFHQSIQIALPYDNNYITIEASVLHLSGRKLCHQPILSSSDNNSLSRHILCFNGEAYNIQENKNISQEKADTQILAETVFSTIDSFLALPKIQNESVQNDIINCINKVLSEVNGPFSFLYLNTEHWILIFGKDQLGRRSLLANSSLDECQQNISNRKHPFIISSIGTSFDVPYQWIEIKANNIFYSMDVSNDFYDSFNSKLQYHHWVSKKEDGKMNEKFEFVSKNTSKIEWNDISKATILENDATIFGKLLDEAVGRRVSWIRDSTNSTKTFSMNKIEEKLPSIAILFSGGIDCLTIASLADKYLDSAMPIELINVAFENMHKSISIDVKDHYFTKTNIEFCVPDRITALNSLKELQDKSPQRDWKLIQVDVSIEDYIASKPIILTLMSPKNTVMDLSIAAAFYWAAKGEGNIYYDTTKSDFNQHLTQTNCFPYKSKARVLLSGLGADELMGGYGHHRAAFYKNISPTLDEKSKYVDGWEAVDKALALDVDRISLRNMGRDDRIISYHGKEVRYPYLDGPVVDFLTQLYPVWRKCNFLLPPGIGDKRILRFYADHYLGFSHGSHLLKRAIQFGSRTAKLELPQSRGTDIVNKSCHL